MSSSQNQANAKGLSRFIRRASSVLRSKPVAVSGSQAADQSDSSTPGPATAMSPTAQDSTPLVARSRPIGASSSATATPATEPLNTSRATDPRPVSVPREGTARDVKAHSAQQQAKAKALFSKYGFTLETRDWTPPSKSSEVEWVEKKVRMRIHRQCHRCSTSFGAGKECANCSHIRCKSCPRFPPKPGMVPMKPNTDGLVQIEQQLAHVARTSEDGPEPDVKAVKPSLTGRAYSEQDKIIRKAAAEKDEIMARAVFGTGAPIYVHIDPQDQDDRKRARHFQEVSKRRGADVVYRAPAHRVRRMCHKCETIFKGRATECESCGHARCASCPREPAKISKFPTGQGYPGDMAEMEPAHLPLERVWRKPRTRVRWTCHECDVVFSSSSEKKCKGCTHARCDLCARSPTKKLLKEHPEELLNGLEGKFIGLKFLSNGTIQAVGVEPVGA